MPARAIVPSESGAGLRRLELFRPALPGAFKAGDGQAIRISGELAYTDIDVDLEISRFGDVITIFPARNAMSDSVVALRRRKRIASKSRFA
jgi:antitoxin VapB